jgi:1,2-diacylglycerol-3-alpha-glucose alpha-1,2-glucosyltransferase
MDLTEFAKKTTGVLTGTLPDLTASGLRTRRNAAGNRGKKLVRIYQRENILSSVYLQANSSLETADTINTSTCKEGLT